MEKIELPFAVSRQFAGPGDSYGSNSVKGIFCPLFSLFWYNALRVCNYHPHRAKPKLLSSVEDRLCCSTELPRISCAPNGWHCTSAGKSEATPHRRNLPALPVDEKAADSYRCNSDDIIFEMEILSTTPTGQRKTHRFRRRLPMYERQRNYPATHAATYRSFSLLHRFAPFVTVRESATETESSPLWQNHNGGY